MLVAKEHWEITVSIDNHKLEQVSPFKYLGTEITQENSRSTDIRCCTAQAWAAVNNLRVIWQNTRTSLKTKLRLLDCLVIPIVLYGCETWTRNVSDTKKLQAFGTKCLRKLLNISWHDDISNKEVAVHALRMEEYTINKVQHQQHTWLERILCIEENCLPKISLQAHAHNTRYRGRPRKNWIDAAPEGLGLELNPAIHMAHNIELWRSCIHRTYDHQVVVLRKRKRYLECVCTYVVACNEWSSKAVFLETKVWVNRRWSC